MMMPYIKYNTHLHMSTPSTSKSGVSQDTEGCGRFSLKDLTPSRSHDVGSGTESDGSAEVDPNR